MIHREWDVEFTDEFGNWWATLEESAQDAVARVVRLLELDGPHLGFPYSSDIRGARLGGLRELRAQHRGAPLRVLYAFDPRRTAILLLGGDKSDDVRWYERAVPIAEARYAAHLRLLREEGLIDG